MKTVLLLSASAFLFFSCSDPEKDKEMGDFAADVCVCASEATTQAEWDKCNEKRKTFFPKFELDVDDTDGNKTNDIMFDCLMDNSTFE